MKRITLLFASFILLGSIQVNSQSVLGDEKAYDGVFKREHIMNRKPIPYTPIREADVMWKRRIWRIIDLREKINLPLYYPITSDVNGLRSLTNVLYKAVTEEVSLRVYSASVDDFSVEITPGDVKKLTEKSYEKMIPSMLDPSVDTLITITESFSPNRVKKILLKEEWFFDRQRSVLDVRILGISLLYEQEDKEKGDQPLFWVYFPEARTVLAKYDVFNRKNPMERRSFDDIFWKRQFSSYIIKEENVYDRSINEYKKGLDALLESNRIKEEIVIMEHDLWEF
ncbi:MAG: gliding motility protein GldN [Bacteroidetes bacterium]|nr:gliding motility protein GldN [Bacteroidota bacterium]